MNDALTRGAQEAGLVLARPSSGGSGRGIEYKTSCPFPSCGGKDRFRIQPDFSGKRCMGFWACRVCGKSGDTISFYMDVLNYGYKEACEASGTSNSHTFFSKKCNPYNQQPQPLKSPDNNWHSAAADLVKWAHNNLMKNQSILDSLSKRGLPQNAVEKYQIGYISCDTPREFLKRSSWGLPEEKNAYGNDRPLYLPKGIVIPTIEPSGKVVRIKIRRDDWHPDDDMPKYVAVGGSMNGMNIIGNKLLKTMFVVESELDAFALDYVIGDVAFTVAIGGNNKNPDIAVDYRAKNITHLFICYDNDEGGQTLWAKWKKLYSHSQPCPTRIGKDIGKAIELGEDIRAWILSIIKPDCGADQQVINQQTSVFTKKTDYRWRYE